MQVGPRDSLGSYRSPWERCPDASATVSTSLLTRDTGQAWPVLVINLKDRADRRRQISRELHRHGIDFRFFEATDGRTLDEDHVRFFYDQTRNAATYKRPLSRPEIGCFISHFRVWRWIVEQSLPGAIVLEDDAQIRGDMNMVLRHLTRAQIGGRLVKLDSPRRSRVHRPGHKLTPDHTLVEPWILGPRTTGYVLPRDTAGILIDRMVPFARPIDIELKHWWENGIRILSVEPAPITSSDATVSSLSPARLQNVPSGLWERFIRNLGYQRRLQVGLLRARMGRLSAAEAIDPPTDQRPDV